MSATLTRGFLMLAFLVLAAPVNAGDDDNAYIMGSGARTCGQFAREYLDNPDIEGVYFQWAQGFMTGFNAGLQRNGESPKILSSSPIAEQMAAIRRYCDQHPLADYLAAVMEAFNHLKSSRETK
jgi:hypothetical protein